MNDYEEVGFLHGCLFSSVEFTSWEVHIYVHGWPRAYKHRFFFCGSPVVQLCIGDEHDVGDLEHPHFCEGVTQIYISGHGLLFS